MCVHVCNLHVKITVISCKRCVYLCRCFFFFASRLHHRMCWYQEKTKLEDVLADPNKTNQATPLGRRVQCSEVVGAWSSTHHVLHILRECFRNEDESGPTRSHRRDCVPRGPRRRTSMSGTDEVEGGGCQRRGPARVVSPPSTWAQT